MTRRQNSELADAVTTSAAVVAVLFLVMVADTLLRHSLARFGILPRTGSGLVGILFGPLLHANFHHVMGNAVPLFALLLLLLSDRRYQPYRTLALIWLASGLGTWLIGRGNAVHIGASSIVFGLAAFLITAGFVMRSWRSAVVAIVVVVLYGGLFYGVLPRPGPISSEGHLHEWIRWILQIPRSGPISWEGHLCGAVAGVWTAARMRRAA